MKTTIRRASAADANTICQLFCETAAATGRKFYTEAQVQEFLALYADKSKWVARVEQGHYLVATMAANEIVGCVSMLPMGRIDLVCVHPSQQHGGIGTQLLNAVYEIADKVHLPRLEADTNLVTVPFFEKEGFVVHDVCARDIAGIHFASVVMMKRLCVG